MMRKGEDDPHGILRKGAEEGQVNRLVVGGRKPLSWVPRPPWSARPLRPWSWPRGRSGMRWATAASTGRPSHPTVLDRRGHPGRGVGAQGGREGEGGSMAVVRRQPATLQDGERFRAPPPSSDVAFLTRLFVLGQQLENVLLGVRSREKPSGPLTGLSREQKPAPVLDARHLLRWLLSGI